MWLLEKGFPVPARLYPRYILARRANETLIELELPITWLEVGEALLARCQQNSRSCAEIAGEG